MEYPDSFIEYRQPDYMIVSPTAESGVSITTKYFTEKLTFFAGIQATNAQHQMMFRLRDNSIPHYVACPEYSSIENRSTPRTYQVKKHLEILDNRIDQSAMMAAYSSGNRERVIEVINQAYTRQQDEWWHFAGQLGVLDHFEMQNLRLCLILRGLIRLKFGKPERKMIGGVRQRVYHIDSEIISDPYRLATLEAIEKKMNWWMAEKSQVNWNEQPLSQPTPPPIHTATCPLSTTPPFIKGQTSDGRAGNQVQQAFNEKQSNPIPSEINASPQLDTTPLFIKGQDSGVQPEVPVQQAFNLEEYMTLESLQDIANDLERVAKTEDSDAVEMLEDIRAWMPSEALKAAANLLPKPLRKRIAEMVRSMNTPVEIKPTSEQKPVVVTPHLPQVTKTNKPPTPPLSKEEEAFAEWSQLHKLIEVANEFLAPLAKLLPDQAIEKIKHILTFIPSKAVGLAAGLLTGVPRDNLKPLLLTFDIAID